MGHKRISLKVSEEMYNWINENAEKRALTMNALCILALENYIQQSVVTANLPELLEAHRKMQEEKQQGE